jgi:hypothetical protein
MTASKPTFASLNLRLIQVRNDDGILVWRVERTHGEMLNKDEAIRSVDFATEAAAGDFVARVARGEEPMGVKRV